MTSEETFRDHVIAGFQRRPRRLSPKYFYDERGSELFERICALPEYYPTRTEREILRRYGAEIAETFGEEGALVELGSGSGEKTEILLANASDGVIYVPVDISGEALAESAARIRKRFPQLTVIPVHGDYSASLQLPQAVRQATRRTVYLAGGNIGNFPTSDAVELLKRLARLTDGKGGILVSTDLEKDVAVIEAAYNDSQGVTADFNKNVLARMNAELDADIDLDRFRHEANYNAAEGRIEMYLISRVDQTLTIGSERFDFAAGDRVCTEYSYKYTPNRIAELAGQAGCRVAQTWTDDRGYFAVNLFETE